MPTVFHACSVCGAACTSGYSVTYRGGEEDWSTVRCAKCERLARLEQYRQDKVLTTGLMMDALFEAENQAWESSLYGEDRPYVEIGSSIQSIKDQIRRFDREAWWPDDGPGVRDQVNASKKSGMSARELEAWGLKTFMTWVSAGRVMLQADSEDGHWVSFITVEKHDDHLYLGGEPEDYPRHRMGIQGICAPHEKASALLDGALAAFKAGALQLRDDTDVGMV